MVELERTKLGTFSLEDTYTLEDIESCMYQLLSPEDVLELPKVVIDKELEKKVLNGCVLKKFFDSDIAMIMNENGKLLAIYQKKDNDYVKPYRMFI